jgi:hypothetical protein
MKKILILIVAVFLGFGLFKLLEGFANSTSDAPWGPNIDDVSAQFIIQKLPLHPKIRGKKSEKSGLGAIPCVM